MLVDVWSLSDTRRSIRFQRDPPERKLLKARPWAGNSIRTVKARRNGCLLALQENVQGGYASRLPLLRQDTVRRTSSKKEAYVRINLTFSYCTLGDRGITDTDSIIVKLHQS